MSIAWGVDNSTNILDDIKDGVAYYRKMQEERFAGKAPKPALYLSKTMYERFIEEYGQDTADRMIIVSPSA
jgi:hypothetical protein